MDEIEELKCALGPSGKDYNDAQLRHLSREMDLVAEFLLDLYELRRSRERKTQNSGFDTQGSNFVG